MLATLLRAYINSPSQFDRFELVRDVVMERNEINYSEINCILMRRALEAKCQHCHVFFLASVWLESCIVDKAKQLQLAGAFVTSAFAKLEQSQALEEEGVFILLRTVLNLKGFHEHAMVLSKLVDMARFNEGSNRVYLETLKLLVEFSTQALRDPTPYVAMFMYNCGAWRDDKHVCVALCAHCLAFPKLYFEHRNVLIDCCYRIEACHADIEALVTLWTCTAQYDEVLLLLKQVCEMNSSKLPDLVVRHVKPENRVNVLRWVIFQSPNDNDRVVLHAIATHWFQSTNLSKTLEEWIASTVSESTTMNQCDAIKSAWMCWILGNSNVNNHAAAHDALAKFVSNKPQMTAYEVSAVSSALLKLSIRRSNLKAKTRHCLEMLPVGPQRTQALAHLSKLPTSIKNKVYYTQV